MARRAVVRWAWRMFRREWRQQVLVVALLTLVVALAVAGTSAAYNAAPSRDAEFGTADHRLVSDVSEASDPQVVDDYLAAAEEWYGTVEVIGLRRASVPGSADRLELRAQDPTGPFGAPMLALQDGRYPEATDEVAVTDGVAHSLGLGVGDTLGLDEGELHVVGVVENPGNLDDEFALVPPASLERPDQIDVLVQGSDDRVTDFPAERDPGPGYVNSRGSTERGAAAAGALAASTVVMLLVCLVAAAAFVVLAQRRLRQLGMLAAVGATEKHLRLVVVANGVVAGAVAAVLGTGLGLAGWMTFGPRLESAVQHRMERFAVPWPMVGLAMLLAVTAAGAAAWWPGRTVSRVPVTQALSGRQPRSRRAGRAGLLALPLLAGGVVCLVLGVDAANDKGNDLLLIVGVVAISLGIVFLCPLAIRLLAPLARRLPVATRLALRDLARYQARSGAALAAISLALGVAVAVVLAAAAAVDRADEGNLSDRQLMLRLDEGDEVGAFDELPQTSPGQVDRFRSVVDQVAAGLAEPTVVPLEVVLEPIDGDRSPLVLGRGVSDTTMRDLGTLYVATPDVLRHVGLDPASIDSGADVLTPEQGDLFYGNTSRRDDRVDQAETIDVPRYSSAPRFFVTSAVIEQRGWETAPAAWFVEARDPLTDAQIAEARDLAAGARLTVEVRRGQEGLDQMQTGATVAAVLLGLSIVAMTVGLIRSEARADLRTLTATGASSRMRRALTSTTAATLALLGAVLGTGGAYTGLLAGYSDDLGAMRPVPVLHLAVVILGLPLLAALGGWLLAGREPPTLTRHPLD